MAQLQSGMVILTYIKFFFTQKLPISVVLLDFVNEERMFYIYPPCTNYLVTKLHLYMLAALYAHINGQFLKKAHFLHQTNPYWKQYVHGKPCPSVRCPQTTKSLTNWKTSLTSSVSITTTIYPGVCVSFGKWLADCWLLTHCSAPVTVQPLCVLCLSVYVQPNINLKINYNIVWKIQTTVALKLTIAELLPIDSRQMLDLNDSFKCLKVNLGEDSSPEIW